MKRKRILSFLLTISLLFGQVSPVWAAENNSLSGNEIESDYESQVTIQESENDSQADILSEEETDGGQETDSTVSDNHNITDTTDTESEENTEKEEESVMNSEIEETVSDNDIDEEEHNTVSENDILEEEQETLSENDAVLSENTVSEPEADNEDYVGVYIGDAQGNKLDSLTITEGQTLELTFVLVKEDGTTEIVASDDVSEGNWYLYDKYYTTEEFMEYSPIEQIDPSLLEFFPVKWEMVQDSYGEEYPDSFTGRVYINAKKGAVKEEPYFIMLQAEGLALTELETGRGFWQIPVYVKEAQEGEQFTDYNGVNGIAHSLEGLYKSLREDMVNRKETAVYYVKESVYEEFFANDFDAVFDFDREREGMKTYEGDYLKWQNSSPAEIENIWTGWICTPINFNNENWWSITCEQPFLTTRAQEDEVDAKIEQIVWTEGGELYSYHNASDYEIIEACYNYVREHVSYTETPTPDYHSCWSALIQGEGNSQAYSLLYGRLLREFGIANKMIMGTGQNAHTYNIIEIDGTWYYSDAASEIFGLYGENNFSRTEYQEMFFDEEFVENYINKISAVDYVYPYAEGTKEAGNIVIKEKDDSGQEQELKSFVRWSDAVTYLNSISDISRDYIVEILSDMELKEALTMPSKVKSITFRSGLENDGRIQFSYLGDIKLSSETAFENIDLRAEKYNTNKKYYEEYFSAVNLNGKSLNITNGKASFASVKGNNKAELIFDNAEIQIKKAVTSLGFMDLKYSVLSAENITVTDTLTMQSSKISCSVKVNLKNIVSLDEKNTIAYGGNEKKNILNITGNITSDSHENEAVKVSRTETGESVEKTATIRKNAITLELSSLEDESGSGYKTGIVLCNAPKAGAAWFAVGSIWNPEDSGARTIEYAAYKKSGVVYCGEAEDIVRLYSSDSKQQENFVYEGGFSTLQDAFLEIDKLAAGNKFYRIELRNVQKDFVTFGSKDLVFPSKTAGITIAAGDNLTEAIIYLKEKIVLKSDVIFEDIIFAPAKDIKLELGNFSLTMARCSSYKTQTGNEKAVNENGEAVVRAASVNGSGTAKSSELILEDTALFVTGAVKNIGKLVYTGEQAERLVSYNNVRYGSVPLYSKLEANGAVQVGSIELHTEGTLAGPATVKRSKDNVITGITPQITIAKDVVSEQGKVLYLDLREKQGKSYVKLKLDGEDARTICQTGLSLAKGVNVTYSNIQASQLAGKNLIKKSGNLTYFENDYGVELSYMENDTEIVIPCYSFADAVKEINNRKKKCDYVITLLSANKNISAAAPKALTMPNKKYVNSLVIQAEPEKGALETQLYYLNQITFTSDVTLKDVAFVQMIKKGSEYQDADEVKNGYPAAVTVNTGGFDLRIEGEVTFNTPLLLKGGNKGTLTLDSEGTLNTRTNDFYESGSEAKSIIYGMITDFSAVHMNGCNLEFREYETAYRSGKYTSANIKAADWNLTDGEVTVKDKNRKASFKVTNLCIEDGNVTVGGKINLTNAVLEGTKDTVIKADKDFNITGSLTSFNDNAILMTRLKGAKKAPYLNISGRVIRGENINPVYVGVYPEITAENPDKAVELTEAPKVTGQLLTAKNALAMDFRPIDENYTSGSGEYSQENTKGYMVFKSGSNIYVYEGGVVKVELQKNGNPAGYYPSIKDATTAVNALKDKTAVYTYILTEDNGTAESPVSITLPSQAKEVIVTESAGTQRKIFFTGKLSLGADTSFENIIFEPVNKGKGTAFDISTNGYDLTLEKVEVSDRLTGMAIGNITGKGGTKVTLSSENLMLKGNVTGISELEIKEDVTIGGNIKTSVLTMRNKEDNQAVVLNTVGSVVIDTVENYGNSQNVLQYTRNKSNVSNLTVNKEINNHGTCLFLLEQVTQHEQMETYVEEIALSKKETSVKLDAAKKLAVMPKASGDSFKIVVTSQTDSLDSEELPAENIVKADKGIYYIDDTLMPYRTKLASKTESNAENPENGNNEENSLITYCLDYNQAIKEINNRAEKNADYTITFNSSGNEQVIDTNVTDKNSFSSLPLPKKDTKKSLTVEGGSQEMATIPFTGNISGYGKLIFKNLVLNPVSGGTKSAPADVKLSLSADKTESMMILENVTTNTKMLADKNSKGVISAITGVKNKTCVTIKNCGELIVKSGIHNVQKLTLSETAILTAGKSVINVLRLEDAAFLDVLGKLTVTDIEVSDSTNTSYIGAIRNASKVPQFVVNGDVIEGTLLVKAYNSQTAITDAGTIWDSILDEEGNDNNKNNVRSDLEPDDYTEVRLAEGKRATAERFRAYPFRAADAYGTLAENPEGVTKENFIAYKEGKYIRNGKDTR